MINQEYVFQLDMNATKTSNISYQQFNSDTCVLTIELLNIVGDLTDCTASYVFKNTNSGVVAQQDKVEILNVTGKLTGKVPDKIVEKDGLIYCQVFIKGPAGEELYTPRFAFTVNVSIIDNVLVVESLGNFTDLYNAVDFKSQLSEVVADAEIKKTALDESITTAGTTKESLDDSTSDANTKKIELDESVESSVTAKSDLDDSIETGRILKTDLEADIETAESKKVALEGAIENGDLDVIKTDIANNSSQLADIVHQVSEDETTPSIYNLSSFFSVGKGFNESGEPLDYSESVLNGQVTDARIQGRTWTNLADNGVDYENWDVFGEGTTKSVGGIHLVQDTSNGEYARLDLNLTNNKQYTICYYIENFDILSLGLIDGAFEHDYHMPISLGWNKILKTTKADITSNKLWFALPSDNVDSMYIDIKNVMVLEGDWTEKEVHYINGDSPKSTICTQRFKSTGKNLFDGELEIGGLYVNGSNDDSSLDRIRSKNYIPIKNIEIKGNIDVPYNTSYIVCFDENKNIIAQRETWVDLYKELPLNCEYIRFMITGTTDLNAKVQIEEGDTATDYEEYEENLCYFYALDENGDIVKLDSVGDVSDKFSYSGGKGEGVVEKNISADVILDGSLNWKFYNDSAGSHVVKLDNISSILPNLLDDVSYATEDRAICIKNGVYSLIPSNTMTGQTLERFAMRTDGTYDGFWLSLLDVDTGFPDVYIPSSNEIKAYFYGWKMCNSNGSSPWDGVQTKNWKKIIDETGLTTILPNASYDEYIPYILKYQLAEPQIIPCTAKGNFYAYKNGHQEIIPYISKEFKYTDKITLPKPVSKLNKILDKTGNEIDIDTNISLANDGLSFTITGAVADDVFMVYAPILESENAVGTFSAKYLTGGVKSQVESLNRGQQELYSDIMSVQDQLAMLIVMSYQ